MTFDAETGDAWISDVGNLRAEEVNLLPAGQSGTNFGWRCYEGAAPYVYFAPECDGIEHTPPLMSYPHTTVQNRTYCAVTGGFMYRGELYPNLDGMYLYSDFCAGRVWGLRNEGGSWINYHLIDLEENVFPTAFGTDAAGEIYIGNLDGSIYRLQDNAPPGATPVPTPTFPNNLSLPIIFSGPLP